MNTNELVADGYVEPRQIELIRGGMVLVPTSPHLVATYADDNPAIVALVEAALAYKKMADSFPFHGSQEELARVTSATNTLDAALAPWVKEKV